MAPIKPKKKEDEEADISTADMKGGVNGMILDAFSEIPGLTVPEVNNVLPKVLMGMNQGMAPKVDGITPEERLTVEMVVANKDAASREQFCLAKMPNNVTVCRSDYCNMGCRLAVSPEKFSQWLDSCVRICNGKEEPKKNPMLLHDCLVPSVLANSYYRWCDDMVKLHDKGRKQTCKYDGCKACCVHKGFYTHTNISSYSITECLSNCYRSLS